MGLCQKSIYSHRLSKWAKGCCITETTACHVIEKPERENSSLLNTCERSCGILLWTMMINCWQAEEYYLWQTTQNTTLVQLISLFYLYITLASAAAFAITVKKKTSVSASLLLLSPWIYPNLVKVCSHPPDQSLHHMTATNQEEWSLASSKPCEANRPHLFKLLCQG